MYLILVYLTNKITLNKQANKQTNKLISIELVGYLSKENNKKTTNNQYSTTMDIISSYNKSCTINLAIIGQ